MPLKAPELGRGPASEAPYRERVELAAEPAAAPHAGAQPARVVRFESDLDRLTRAVPIVLVTSLGVWMGRSGGASWWQGVALAALFGLPLGAIVGAVVLAPTVALARSITCGRELAIEGRSLRWSQLLGVSATGSLGGTSVLLVLESEPRCELRTVFLRDPARAVECVAQLNARRTDARASASARRPIAGWTTLECAVRAVPVFLPALLVALVAGATFANLWLPAALTAAALTLRSRLGSPRVRQVAGEGAPAQLGL